MRSIIMAKIANPNECPTCERVICVCSQVSKDDNVALDDEKEKIENHSNVTHNSSMKVSFSALLRSNVFKEASHQTSSVTLQSDNQDESRLTQTMNMYH